MTGKPSYARMIADAMSAETEFVRVDHHGAVAVLTLNDPARLNALSPGLSWQLRERLVAQIADPAVAAIVLTGADPAFSAGGDIRMMVEAHRTLAEGDDGAVDLWRWIRHQFGGVARAIVATDKPVIAAVNGAAAGVGLAYVLASDLILCSERARLVIAFARIGLVPEVGTSWFLTRRLGYQRAYELYVSGDEIDGRRAVELGLANRLVAHADLLPAALAMAERCLAVPGGIRAMTKTLLRRAADMTWDQAIAMEEFAEPICFTTQAHQQAVRRFIGGGRAAE
jgi:2-(1,2-epoxy-1,2-dihydrophenyl)acetyl-CoA isomerase